MASERRCLLGWGGGVDSNQGGGRMEKPHLCQWEREEEKLHITVDQKEQEGQHWFRVLAKAFPDRNNSQETSVQSLTLERTLEIQTITWTPVTVWEKLRERDTANAGSIKSFIFPN